MHDSKLIQSIKVLTMEELEGVKQLLNTDLLLKGSYKNEAIRLFEYIIPYYPKFESNALDRNIVLEEIFKGEGSKINRLEKSMSALLNIIDFYVIHFILDTYSNEARNNISLASFYMNRRNKTRSKYLMKKASEYLENNDNVIDVFYYDLLYFIQYESLNIEDFIDGNFKPEAYLELFKTIDEIAFLKKLNHLYKIIARRPSLNENVENKIIEMQSIMENNLLLQNNILVKIMFSSINLLKNSTNDNFDFYYQNFLSLIEINKNRLKHELLRELSAIENICAGLRLNHFRTTDMVRFASEISKKHLLAGYMTYNGRIHNIAVVNFINTSLRLKEDVWLKEFVTNYKDHLGGFEENKDLINLCWAAFHFLQKDYISAGEFLMQKSENYFIQTVVRRLNIKIYYETKEEIILTYEVDSFKVYIYRLHDRKAIDINIYEANNNFCNRLKQIINLRHNPDEKTKERLYKKVEEQKCSDKEWLLEKIEEIKVPYTKL